MKKKSPTKSFHKGWKEVKESYTVPKTNLFYVIGQVTVLFAVLGLIAKALGWAFGLNDCLIN